MTSALTRVPNSAHRTHVRIPGHQLAEKLNQPSLTEQNADDSVVLNAQDGSFRLVDGTATPQQGETVLPLRFGPLRNAMQTIEKQQGWLLSHQPVIKNEGQEDARIDFINYGGFVFDGAGDYKSHSVNPW
jgi:hypothetical protein